MLTYAFKTQYKSPNLFVLFFCRGMLWQVTLKYVNHPNTDDIKHIELVRMEMKWRTADNDIDCGIFYMRHMECYDGEEVEKWNCGFHKEYEQPAIINNGKNKKKQ
ncbi:hypothetical protein Hanom_Chr13g01198841 [Helianthus anomalus]